MEYEQDGVWNGRQRWVQTQTHSDQGGECHGNGLEAGEISPRDTSGELFLRPLKVAPKGILATFKESLKI